MASALKGKRVLVVDDEADICDMIADVLSVCRVDTALIHQADGFLSGERRDLPMRQIARQAAAPDVDLGINDLHSVLSSRLRAVHVRGRPCTPGRVTTTVVSASFQVPSPSLGQHGAVRRTQEGESPAAEHMARSPHRDQPFHPA